jgi:hypothetical protein
MVKVLSVLFRNLNNRFSAKADICPLRFTGETNAVGYRHKWAFAKTSVTPLLLVWGCDHGVEHLGCGDNGFKGSLHFGDDLLDIRHLLGGISTPMSPLAP